MTTFWLLAIAMTIAALAFIVPPLLRNRETADVDRDQLNTAVIKEQLAELQADLEAGKLDQAAYATARQDLERELLNDLGDTETQDSGQQSGRWAIALFVPLVPLLAIAIYQQLGPGEMLEKITSGQPPPMAAADGTAPPHKIEDVVAKLAQRLNADPDNPESLQGWVLLARAYASMQRFTEAAHAYRQARKLSGDRPDILIDYADMLATANKGNFTDEVGDMLRSALQQQPDNAKGLWLMGHWKYQHQDFAGAIQDWQKVAQQLPAEGKDAQVISQQIQQARMKIAAAGGTLPQSGTSAAAPQPAPAVASKSSIEVSVSLDAALKDKVKPGDTVFIFARAAKGPRMPLAIVRKRVSDLPVTVTLDDTMAMSPAMVLSAFPQVTVGARVSKSGQAMPSDGDLQGSKSPVETADKQSISIVINEVLGSTR